MGSYLTIKLSIYYTEMSFLCLVSVDCQRLQLKKSRSRKKDDSNNEMI